MSNDNYVAVTRADSIGDRSFSCFTARGAALVICRFRGEYYALENQCSHAQSTFDEGRLRAFSLICPLHGGSFDIRDGSAVALPARTPVRTFPTRVVDGMIEVQIQEP